MSKRESGRTHDQQGRGVDRKAVFDAGYNAYEDGKHDSDFGPNFQMMVDDPSFAAIWRYGWQRAHEDSTLSTRNLQVE